jgi:pyridoxal phosphate enzyme (YggS family)
MNGIANNIHRIQQELPTQTQLVVVSKYRELEEIQAAYNGGQRVFAENRVQPLLERYDQLPKNIEWHLIGHLQSNKVKYIAPFIAMIHSVDSLTLLNEIQKQASKNNRIIKCLFQLHLAQEESKFGIKPNNIDSFFEGLLPENYPNIEFAGIMSMGSLTEDSNLTHKEFSNAQNLFHHIKTAFFPKLESFKELSIGMSGDYKIAVQYGSTMVRIGSKVFED